MLNKTYEKSLRENTGQMISVIEKMQRMVEQVTSSSVLYAFMTLYFDRFVLTYYVFTVQTTALTNANAGKDEKVQSSIGWQCNSVQTEENKINFSLCFFALKNHLFCGGKWMFSHANRHVKDFINKSEMFCWFILESNVLNMERKCCLFIQRYLILFC